MITKHKISTSNSSFIVVTAAVAALSLSLLLLVFSCSGSLFYIGENGWMWLWFCFSRRLNRCWATTKLARSEQMFRFVCLSGEKEAAGGERARIQNRNQIRSSGSRHLYMLSLGGSLFMYSSTLTVLLSLFEFLFNYWRLAFSYSDCAVMISFRNN